jgi:hypothetical protein
VQSHESRQAPSWLIFDVRQRMIPWEKSKQTNEAGVSWLDYRYISGGLRCVRSGRSYWHVSHGRDWRAEDRSKIAKIEFQRGGVVDMRIGSGTPDVLERTLKFAVQCVKGDLGDIDVTSPVELMCGKRIKHLICCVRYYEPTHPVFGALFSGQTSKVTIADMVAMIADAQTQRSIRVPPRAFRFDPKD